MSARRFIKSVLTSRIRVTNAMTARMSSPNLSDLIICCSHFRTSSMSGAWAEVMVSGSLIREPYMLKSNDRRQQNSARQDFFSGCTTGLPSRPSSRIGEIDSLEDQCELRGFDRMRHELAVGRKCQTKAPTLEALVTQDELQALRMRARTL